MPVKKSVKEWLIQAPWGNIAMVSWGDSLNPPVLMLHGYMDCSSTFIPLVEHLPDTYYYVGFDNSGHGLSDTMAGPLPSQLHIIEMIRLAVEHMKWDKFICIGHSVGFLAGLVYNVVYPGRISKLVSIDPEKGITAFFYSTGIWWHLLYGTYYENFNRYNLKEPKLYSYDQAVSMVAKNRSLTNEQAAAILTRALIKEGDKYRFSMDPRMKKTSSLPITGEGLHSIMMSTTCPMLIIFASEGNTQSPEEARNFSSDFVENLLKCRPDIKTIRVEGKHDVHITHPEIISKVIAGFLGGRENSKL